MNKNLPYYDIIMRSDMLYDLPIKQLPEDYSYKAYENGDEHHWAKLEYEVNEFDSESDALAYFNRVFMPHQDCLSKRMFFILDENGRYVATSSAWFKDDEKRHYCVLHWVSVSPTQQGKGLGNKIVTYALSHFPKLDPNEKEIYLHTQTWSYIAISLYYKLGFRITKKGLIDSYTDMKCMDVLKEVLPKELTDNLVEQ